MHLSPTSKLGYLSFKMFRGIPVMNPYANLHLHEIDNLEDSNEFKNLYKGF